MRALSGRPSEQATLGPHGDPFGVRCDALATRCLAARLVTAKNVKVHRHQVFPALGMALYGLAKFCSALCPQQQCDFERSVVGARH